MPCRSLCTEYIYAYSRPHIPCLQCLVSNWCRHSCCGSQPHADLGAIGLFIYLLHQPCPRVLFSGPIWGAVGMSSGHVMHTAAGNSLPAV